VSGLLFFVFVCLSFPLPSFHSPFFRLLFVRLIFFPFYCTGVQTLMETQIKDKILAQKGNIGSNLLVGHDQLVQNMGPQLGRFSTPLSITHTHTRTHTHTHTNLSAYIYYLHLHALTHLLILNLYIHTYTCMYILNKYITAESKRLAQNDFLPYRMVKFDKDGFLDMGKK